MMQPSTCSTVQAACGSDSIRLVATKQPSKCRLPLNTVQLAEALNPEVLHPTEPSHIRCGSINTNQSTVAYAALGLATSPTILVLSSSSSEIALMPYASLRGTALMPAGRMGVGWGQVQCSTQDAQHEHLCDKHGLLVALTDAAEHARPKHCLHRAIDSNRCVRPWAHKCPGAPAWGLVW